MIDDHGLTASRTPAGPVDAFRRRIVSLAWWGGALILGLVALSAVVRTAQVFAAIWGPGPDRVGLLWIGAAIALVGVGLAALGGVVSLARYGHHVAAFSIGMATLIALRAMAVGAIPTPLLTDWRTYHALATILVDGGDYQSPRPPGWPFALSLLYRIAGPNPVLGELANLACAVGIGSLIYVIASRTFGRAAAAASLFLWAVSPGPVVFSAVLASEPLFTLLFVGAIASAAFAIDRSWRVWVLVGILLALSHYVRSAGLVIVPAFMVFPWLAGIGRRRATAAAFTVLVTFAVMIGPSVVWQYQRYGQVVLSTSNYDGWSLLVGLNVAHNGQFNVDDFALVGAAAETVEFRNRSYRLAIDRLRADPGAVLALAAPKFGLMWGDNTYGVGWTLAPDPPRHPRVAAAMTLLSQVGYAIIVVLAVGCLWLRRHERDPVVLLTCLCLGAVALSEVFLEVQPRYHAPFEPLFCLLAGLSVGWLAERFRRRPQDSATSEALARPPSNRREAVTDSRSLLSARRRRLDRSPGGSGPARHGLAWEGSHD